MRTTIDLPDDLHSYAQQLAQQQRRSMGEVIADLIRAGLRATQSAPSDSSQKVSRQTGVVTVSVGHIVTDDDVRSLDDGSESD